jgi:flavin reductase (DIM6/NTAB) family NADH-FMN oxidoreductase RutF
MSIDPIDFRQALGRFASGVTVVTMRGDDGEVRGITVSAFLSLSLSPPLVGIAIDRHARTHALLERVPRFAVSVLNADQEGLSNHFAGRSPELDDAALASLAGHPVIRDALAQLVCRIVDRVPTGDHTLIVGEIEAIHVGEGDPLAYYRGDYRRLR